MLRYMGKVRARNGELRRNVPGKRHSHCRGGGELGSPASVARHTEKQEKTYDSVIWRGKCLASSSSALDTSKLGAHDSTTVR